MCTEDQFSYKLENLSSMSYRDLCSIKEHSVFHHSSRGLKMIEDALFKKARELRKAGY